MDRENKFTNNKVYAVEILDIFRNNKEEAILKLNDLSEEIISMIIDEADNEEKIEILNIFTEDKQSLILEQVSSDELVDLVGELNEDEANKILEKIDEEYKQEVKELLQFAPDTAGGIMAKEYISINENVTVGELLKHLQNLSSDIDVSHYIYIVDNDNKLKGVVSLREIVACPFDKYIMDIATIKVISVNSDMYQNEVANLFEKYGLLSLPVVSETNEMMGIITVDDIIDVLKDESTKDIHGLGGIDKSEKVDGKLIDSIKSRLPWLIINLITAILASMVVSVFEDTINKVVILATFMPIVAGMGGNAGTQTMTIIVRALAMGEISIEKAKKIFLKEISVGVVTGLILGIIISVLGVIWSGKPVFGFIIGFAMILNILIANVAGFCVPMVLKILKIDPALASSVFVTTVTDVLGFLFFLGLAKTFISYLI